MSNHNGSSSGSESSGSIGPVTMSYRNWCSQRSPFGTSLEEAWFVASLEMYNLMVELLRTDAQTIAAVTAAIKHDIDSHFSSSSH